MLSASIGERSRRAGKRVACAGIVAAAGVTLGVAVHHDLQFTAKVTTPAAIGYQTTLLRREECLYRALRSDVPKGAAFYVSGPFWTPRQELAELSTLWAVPQTTPDSAGWLLSLVQAQGHCSGQALEAHRR